jgi:3-methylfumaryl-CoA hydratase
VNDVEFEDIEKGHALPETFYEPSMQQLFLYAASTWNAHRIHYDHIYATGVEGYRNIVIQGPLVADFFVRHVTDWLNDRGRIVAYEYSNRIVSHLGETLVAKSEIRILDKDEGRMEIVGHVENARGEIVLPGQITVALQ